MIDFWIVASLLLLAALAFLLVPLLRGRRVQLEEDRTALNVALYQERLNELNAQLAANTLTQAELDAGRAEAERELLSDTQDAEIKRSAHLGRAAPLVAAFLVPLIGFGLYMYWGASDKVQLAREFAEQPKTIEEMTGRLERAVAAQPDSAEAWYFLARTYMSQERPGDAAEAYARVIALSGRDPELLGQLAQALYFARDRTWSDELQKLTDEALQANPAEVTSLGLLGIAAYEDERYQDAIQFWERLVAELPEGDSSRAPIQAGIARAREQLGEPAVANRTDAQPESDQTAAVVQVQVVLDPALIDDVKPDDALFIFARAVSGPPMPLAVKRLTVGQLPATVSLSDADAMTPQLRLSNFESVRLFARISRSGNALKGEWMGQSEVLEPGAGDTVIQLSIDQPDSR